ncbi:MAG TPA: ATP-binding protein [Candidatus Nanoarchaeia archaeon]|nr:ATP-binding protein [Candidatus Nanoarchaeia archaeon]
MISTSEAYSEKNMAKLNDLVLGLGYEERQELARRQTRFMSGQKRVLDEIATKIETKLPEIEETKKGLKKNYQPNGQGSFLEVEGFVGFNSLQFFHDAAKLLDDSFSPALESLPKINQNAKSISVPNGQSHDRTDLINIVEGAEAVADAFNSACEIRDKGVFPFEQIVKNTYKRAVDQFKYLQKRFLNIGADDSRAYRDPWENGERKGGFDLGRVPYVKTELVRDNALLTDLLLDVAEQLPREHVKKERIKGKRKPKEVKFLDSFDVDRAARVLVELSDPTYQGYVTQPQTFLAKVAKSIGDYYQILSSVDPKISEFIGQQEDNPMLRVRINHDALRKTMPDPSPIVSRLSRINYNSIHPEEEDVRPSSQLERRHFAARRALMEHLATTLDSIGRTQSYTEKFEIARTAVEKGVKLKEKVRGALETTSTIKLNRDKRTDNEFYVGTSSGHGEFGFKREAAPNVRLKDVVGKSFDEMKQHLTDLADYSKYLSLYGATAPRGKIRSNIIAIGPYGCGKTEIGRAIAGDPRFIGAEVSVTNILTCWFGEFEKNVDRVWDAAKELRRNSGDSKLVFLLMDEFDSWFNSSNGHWVDNTYQRVQKAIQMKLDGVVDYEGIITVGFTNEPKKVPLAIYRRFKYVDIVGELEPEERTGLLKTFLTNGLPLSSGFRQQNYQQWGEMLDGATGDVVGKIADDIHYEFMRKFIDEHSSEGRKLNNQIRRMQSRNGGQVDKPYIKRTMGQYMVVTPDWVDQKLRAKLAEPIIREQIDTAKRVYAEAKDVLANLHTRKDVASGSVVQDCRTPNSQYRTNVE